MLLSADMSNELQGEESGTVLDEVHAELRLRLLTGFKRFFAEKTKEGLLRSDALRILNNAADR